MTRTIRNLAALAVLSTALVATSAQAATQCDTFAFNGQTEQADPQSPFVGSMELTNLATGATHSVGVVTMLLGFTGPDMAVTSHEIRGAGTPGIDLVTFDDAGLVPTGASGEYTLLSRLRVKTGAGAYTCGELVTDASSTVNLATGVARYTGFGRLCRCKPSDN